MKMLLDVFDNGSVYIVNSTSIVREMPLVLDPSITKIEISNTQVFAIITEELLQNNNVKLPRGMAAYKPSDIIVDVVDDLTAAKLAARIKIGDFTASRASATYVYDIFEFQMVSNVLYAEGIFITDSNREAKYIEIIETNRVELIEALEKYLNIKDKMSEYYALHSQSKIALQFVENANTLQDVEMYTNNFIASFR